MSIRTSTYDTIERQSRVGEFAEERARVVQHSCRNCDFVTGEQKILGLSRDTSEIKHHMRRHSQEAPVPAKPTPYPGPRLTEQDARAIAHAIVWGPR